MAVGHRKRRVEQVSDEQTDLNARVAQLEASEAELIRARSLVSEIAAKNLTHIESLPDAVTIIQDEKVVFTNNTAMDMFRLTNADDFLGVHPLQFVSEEQREQPDGYLHRRVAGAHDVSQHYETVLRRNDGEEFPAEVRVRTFPFGGRDALQVVVTDIRDRREAEKRLRMLAAMTEQCDEGIAVIDPEGRIVCLNLAFAEMHGYTPQELLNDHVAKLFSPRYMLSLAAAKWQTRQTGHFSGESYHLCKDGTEVPVLANFSVFRDEKGVEIGFVMAARDISETKVTEKLLRLSHDKAAHYASDVEARVRNTERDLEISEGRLREYAHRLEQSNEALKMMVRQFADRREALEQEIYHNLTTMVRPILDELTVDNLPESARLLLQTLGFNINSIFSSFGSGSDENAGRLTPRESRLCELIRSGLSSKEIAEIMDIAPATVDTHRTNIRKKLGLAGSRDNLTAYLKSRR